MTLSADEKPPGTIGLKFTDCLLQTSVKHRLHHSIIGIQKLELQPCSLDTYLRSNQSAEEQEAGGFDGLKQVFPYGAIGKTMDEDGRPTDYRFCLDDFADSLLGGRNSLAWPWQQWQDALHQWDGDHVKALASLNLTKPPDTPEEAFAKLQATWEANGLETGVMVAYAIYPKINNGST